MDRQKWHIENYNNDFLLIKANNEGELQALGRTIFNEDYDFVEEVIVCETEICVKLKQEFGEKEEEKLLNLSIQKDNEQREFELPVYFEGGVDWEEVIKHTRKSKEEIISSVLNAEFKLSMYGFLPGFAYLNGLPVDLHVPRKKVPALHVEEGSIAIGGKYLGVYTVNSPGGWNVIGSTPLHLLNKNELPPSPLNVGDQIKVVRIEKEEYQRLLDLKTKSHNEFSR